MNNSIIVYRNQNEANLDWFLQECLFPWLYNHWWVVAIVIVALLAGVFIAPSRNRY